MKTQRSTIALTHPASMPRGTTAIAIALVAPLCAFARAQTFTAVFNKTPDAVAGATADLAAGGARMATLSNQKRELEANHYKTLLFTIVRGANLDPETLFSAEPQLISDYAAWCAARHQKAALKTPPSRSINDTPTPISPNK